MKSLLDALQEGRLIELPEIDKGKILNLLATLIEAIPDFRGGFDFAGAVASREAAANTGIGHGWAGPHGRVSGEGDLFCAIGWSPTGIDYGAPDGKPVRIVVMHYIPDSQKNVYLREIAGLAKAIKSNPALGELSGLKDLSEVRHRLIDLLTAAVDSALPDVKARMIQLEAKQAVSALSETLPADVLSALSLIPLSVIVVPGARPLILAQDKELVAQIETGPDVVAPLGARVPFDHSGYRVFTRSVSSFQPDRLLYDCIAVKLPGSAKKPA
ncbi:MAG: PTS sugar transporter subunit IIA [Spirochaetia bacterium]|jgi:mannitol/fructose-specific phosphotransferase system IIA component (Ntr-type)